MNTFYSTTTRGNFNPYRHGVLIGNFVEDIFGTDLQKRFRSESQGPSTKKFPISEMVDKYRWPQHRQMDVITPGNDLTMPCNSNFDLNIDFTKKNCEDFLKLAKDNEYVLDNKNAFLPNEIKAEFQAKKFYETMTGFKMPKDICSETQRRLKEFHMRDTKGVLYSKKQGLSGNLLFGHGMDQKKFKTNEFASTYHLTMNKKERTDTFYNPKYRVKSPFMHQPKTFYDSKDWGFRKFKTYEDFTKRFDKATCLEK